MCMMKDLSAFDCLIKTKAEGILYHKFNYYCGCGAILTSALQLFSHLGLLSNNINILHSRDGPDIRLRWIG